MESPFFYLLLNDTFVYPRFAQAASSEMQPKRMKNISAGFLILIIVQQESVRSEFEKSFILILWNQSFGC